MYSEVLLRGSKNKIITIKAAVSVKKTDDCAFKLVRVLAFYQCSPGYISTLGVICRLSLLVLYSALRGFYPGALVFPSHHKPTFNLI